MRETSVRASGSRLPRGVVLVGSVRGQGDLHVAGEVEGPIEIDGQLVIEAEGRVRGDVRARSVIVHGRLEGHATAVELVRLEAGARMVGDARADRVSAAAGAQLRGRVRTSQERAHFERMRRTTGGTLLAPFSSSGALLAPSSSGTASSPLEPTVAAVAPSESTPPNIDRAPIDEQAAAQPGPGRRRRARRDTSSEFALEAAVRDDEDAHMARRPAAPTDEPPPPRMPRIGRRHALRRGEDPP